MCTGLFLDLFRRDADIYRPYDTASNVYWQLTHEGDQDEYISELIKSKSKLAIWVSSENSLNGSKKRLEFTDELVAAGLNLDRRGKLFPNAPKLPPGQGGPELDELLKSYKFYMSFENQWHCRDYITEKVWNNGFRSEAVPVVWGPKKEDYEKSLPPNSYIYADDYTTEELVKCLI